jgi:hypothetical protein
MRSVWDIGAGSYVKVKKLGVWSPSASQFIIVDDVPISTEKKICLSTTLLEWDGGVGDDDFGSTSRLISFDTGWVGEHVLAVHGKDDNAADVTVRITLE